MENIWELLEAGYKQLGHNFSQKEAVLILGNSGSGKSSLATLLALDNTKFMSIENIKGSHEFVLDDSGARIGHTISSTTKVPELIIDNTTNISYYDCPGFNDNRSAAQDLSSTFFLKYVTDSVESVKIVFTVIHGSLRAGLDKNDLLQFLRHATDLIKDLEKFKNSIALVVTKVELTPYFEDEQYKFPTENQVIQSIASYLEEVISTLNERNVIANDDSDFYKRATDFIKILLKKEVNVFRNIALFRKSDRFGPVSNNPILQNNKKQIVNMINNIKYEAKSAQDFGYSIADSSKSMISHLGRDMDKKITGLTEDIVIICIDEKINKLESKSDDLNELNMEIEDALKRMTNVIEQVSQNVSTPLEYSKVLSDNFQVGETSIEQLAYYSKFLDFFKLFSDDEAMVLPLKWISAIQLYKKGAFKEKQTYYTFVNELYEKLSSYSIQRSLDKSYEYLQKLNESTDWTTIVSSISNIEKNTNIKFTDMGYLKDSKLGPEKLNLVRNIINITLNNNLNFKCNNDTCTATGDLIILSNIINNVVDRKNVNLFKIYASHKIFTDQDIILVGRNASLIIIAPIWEIMGRRIFDVSGKKGDSWSPNKAENGIHFSSSSSLNGKHGKPGRPGGAAGSFCAIGGKFLNEGDLTILANGGLGGSGQDGGDGANGNGGSDALEESQSPSECPPNTFLCTFKDISDCSFTELYFNNGMSGEKGGAAGDGGVGGEGGQKGQVIIIGLNDKSKLNIENTDGKNGTGGEGGKFGLGGRNGDNIKGEFSCVRTTVRWGISISTKYTYYQTNSKVLQRYNSGYAKNGTSGVASHNTEGKELKDTSKKLPNTEIIIAEYKSLLENRLKVYFEIKQPMLKNFVENLGKRDKRSVAMFDDVNSEMDGSYVTNSAVSEKSPISCVFSWIKNTALSIINTNSVATTFIGKETLFNKIDAWRYSHEAVFTPKSQAADVCINANLVLADLIVRKFTKQKMKHNSTDIEEVENKAVVLNIIDDINEVMRDVEKELNLPKDTLFYDPLILMKDVNTAIHNGRYSNVVKSLLSSTECNVA